MRALITINNLCYFQRMLELARQLMRGKVEVFCYLHGFAQFEARNRELCAAAGITVVGEPQPRWFGRLARSATVSEAATTLWLVRMIRSQIAKHSIDVVIMPEDSPDYGGPAITAAARAEHVPVAVLASLGSTPLEELANIYMYSAELAGGGVAQRLAAFLFPEWRFRFRDRSILRSPVERILVQKLLRIAAAKPWVYYSGHGDAILVDSEEVRSFCVAHGLPADRVRVTGFVEHDVLAAGLRERHARRAKLDRELGLDGTKPMLLLALVQEHFIAGAPACDFQQHADMVEFIVKAVAAAASFQVVVCLHPSMPYDEFRYIEQWGVKIARWPTVDLIPLCDVYVASGSSTIGWAVAAGKPVINYDVYRYDLSAYRTAPAVLTVQTQADFRAALARVDDGRQRAQLAADAAASANRWGVLDGCAFDRIVATLDELVGRRGTQPLRAHG